VDEHAERHSMYIVCTSTFITLAPEHARYSASTQASNCLNRYSYVRKIEDVI